ncbi:MAG: hypothetical protein QGG36_15360 [Pirellulaceae bacterium]|jgi:hypothetical protein|nr:hypothetical protein [Pirellulaceae bacterium]
MANFFKKLFGKAPDDGLPADLVEDTTDPAESIEELYGEFCETFLIEPGVTLISRLRADGHDELLQWLRWDTDKPEPKALIRLGVSAFRGGLEVWDGSPLDMFIEGDPAADGGPSEESVTGLSWFCKITRSPITIYWDSLAEGQIHHMEITLDG